jgi:hypothetical protein
LLRLCTTADEKLSWNNFMSRRRKIYRQEEQKINKITTSKHNIFKEQKILSMDPEKPSSKHISYLTGGDPGIPDRGVAVPEPVRKQVYKENQHMENVLPDSMNNTERKPSV